jgi:four helix bundle protein
MSDKVSRKYDLEERLISFSVRVITIAENLPKTFTAQYLSKQIIRSAISPALNYGEAQAAESRKDFIHKIKVVLKELRETKNALEIIKRKEYYNSDEIQSIQNECGELIAIFMKSIETANKNLNK